MQKYFKNIVSIFLLFFVTWQCNAIKIEKFIAAHPEVNGQFKLEKGTVFVYASVDDKKKAEAEIVVFPHERQILQEMFAIYSEGQLLQIYQQKGSKEFSPAVLAQLRADVEKKNSRSNDFSLKELDHKEKEDPQRDRKQDNLAQLPLHGFKVALDPGHLSRNFDEAVVEAKFISIPLKNKIIKFYEADLVRQTTEVLKHKLEQLGATVFVSDPHVHNPNFSSFQKWLESDSEKKRSIESEFAAGNIDTKTKSLLLEKNNFVELRAFYFREYDLRQRARWINTFKPDVSIFLHMNATLVPPQFQMNKLYELEMSHDKPVKNYKKKMEKLRRLFQRSYTTTENYAVFFIGGAFHQNELTNVRDRMELLRQLITDDFPRSYRLASHVARQINKNLKVDLLGTDFKDPYYLHTPQRGVVARNLKMTRLVHGAVVLAEPVLQNNIQEAIKLSTTDAKWQGKAISSRILAIADSYYNAIVAYHREFGSDAVKTTPLVDESNEK